MSQSALVELSRWQWALSASFHMMFPAVTAGTSAVRGHCPDPSARIRRIDP